MAREKVGRDALYLLGMAVATVRGDAAVKEWTGLMKQLEVLHTAEKALKYQIHQFVPLAGYTPTYYRVARPGEKTIAARTVTVGSTFTELKSSLIALENKAKAAAAEEAAEEEEEVPEAESNA